MVRKPWSSGAVRCKINKLLHVGVRGNNNNIEDMFYNKS